MKNKAINLVLFLAVFTFTASCSSSNSPVGPDGGEDGGDDTDSTMVDPNAPPVHWYQDFQGWNTLLKRVYYNKHVAVYYDSRVPRTMTWPYQFLQRSGRM